jgi:Ser/Thr protein kinase RdoA (MazF antagonist)
MNGARRALASFVPGAPIRTIAPVPGGNVNRSFRVRLADGTQYLLQRLSPAAFPHPERIMANLVRVSGHLRAAERNRAGRLRVAMPVPRPDGNLLYHDDEGGAWRLLTWLANTRTLAGPVSPRQALELGRVLGRFHLLLADLDPATLYDSLPGFHHTPTCLAACDRAMAAATRLDDPREEACCLFVERLRGRAGLLEEHRSRLCRTIIHADPKVANFLFANDRDEAVALIDLDTVMPGLLLHDLGDALRSCCSQPGEEGAPEQVVFDRDLFAAFIKGYAGETGRLLGAPDRNLLAQAPLVIAFELGLRFFTDHLQGNTYFRISRPDQNLDRALVQFHLAASIQAQQKELAGLLTV